MKKNLLFILCIIMFAQQANSQWFPGVTVAGGNGEGAAANQLFAATDVFVDASGNLFIADLNNHRIQKWAPGASSGITVAGGNGKGSAANQFNLPWGVFVDMSGNIYVADEVNNRVQKWIPGATSGTTVAGGNGAGSAANQLNSPHDVFVDPLGNIYVADEINDRIQKWTPGATAGSTVAGGNGEGAAANQLHFPTDVFVDATGNILVADQANGRVQKWAPGASTGITVAGGNGFGGAANQLNAPRSIFITADGYIYVADNVNKRIQLWAPGASAGVTVTSINDPFGVFVDASGSVYVAESNDNRIQKFESATGLGYKYYEGNFEALPNFNFLTPVKTGHSLNVDISPGIAGKSDNFAFLWEGYINITTPGMYTFETVSDDGSKLYFNSFYNPSSIATVNNDGVHAPASAKGTINVTSAGTYPIAITFFEKDGGEQMHVYWTGPGIERQLIPNSAFTQVPPTPQAGLNYKYYEGAWDAGIPDFSTLTPVRVGNTPNIDLGVRTPGHNDNFAFLWEGYISIQTPGIYTFETISDDGSKLYFNQQYNHFATPTVNNDFVHAPRSATGTINIPAAGVFPIAITFFESEGGEQMQVYWSGPGIERQLIPNSAFTQVPPRLSPHDGLNYQYYEGAWDAGIPDFSKLIPVKTGNTPNIDLGVRTPGHNDNFAFLWEGYINIQTPGIYTFETISDDGSKLYFNQQYNHFATPTVNNDFVHAPRSATGTVNVTAAGLYPIAITFFESEGGEQMQVYWTGPGIERQLIPNSAFMQHPPPPPLHDGLNYKYYEGRWDAGIPDFSGLVPVKVGNTPNIDLSVRTPGHNDYFAFLWEGYINIQTPGLYTFETISDDGSKLYFNQQYNHFATPTVSNDFGHAPRSATGTVNIPTAGVYPIAITYFEIEGGELMQVYWSGPGIERQQIPNSAFMQAPPVNSLEKINTNHVKAMDDVAGSNMVNTRMYPNPFDQNFNIDFYNSSAGNNISVGIYDLNGKLCYLEHAGYMMKGNTLLKVKLNGHSLLPGMYTVLLKINGIPSKTVKMVKMK